MSVYEPDLPLSTTVLPDPGFDLTIYTSFVRGGQLLVAARNDSDFKHWLQENSIPNGYRSAHGKWTPDSGVSWVKNYLVVTTCNTKHQEKSNT